MFFKLLLFGFIAGVGAYYYDLNAANKIMRDARYSSIETEHRCQQNHESMCRYFVTVKLENGSDKLFYKFRVPFSYWHTHKEDLPNRRYPVVYKEKKFFPARIVGLAPKLQTDLDQVLAAEK